MKQILASVLKRVKQLEQAKDATKYVGGWPPMLSIEDWEAIAAPMQERLSRGIVFGKSEADSD